MGKKEGKTYWRFLHCVKPLGVGFNGIGRGLGLRLGTRPLSG